MPRRRANQCEMSAISGPNVAELPKPEQAVRQRELPDVGREADSEIAGGERDRADEHRAHDAETVGETAHHDAADAEAEHGERERQRGVAARHAEVGLHRRKRDHERPHADAADRAERKRDAKPHPGIAESISAAAGGAA